MLGVSVVVLDAPVTLNGLMELTLLSDWLATAVGDCIKFRGSWREFSETMAKVEAFLLLPTDPPAPMISAADNTSYAVVMNKAVIGWPNAPPVFNGLDLTIKKGSLTIISGDVCSGKSTLLEAIVGSAQVRAGTVDVAGRARGNVAYGQQLPQVSRQTNVYI